MLDWISGNTFKKIKIQSELIISSQFVFTIDNKIFENVVANLYDQFIILENKKSSIKIIIPFEFRVIFEVIRFEEQDGYLGALRSIKLIYNQNWIELKNSSIPKEINFWVERLKLKLNQKGFHDYYQAIKRIGKGGFASVYLSKKKYQDESYAVKAFSKEFFATESQGLQCLEKEIHNMRSLNHPNLMKLCEVYETQNSFYLCLELFSGGSLADRIRKRPKMTSFEIKKIMKNILEGLEYMHSNNIMHRDLKPDNVLFRTKESDDCVIADFGLAQNFRNKEFLFSRCGTPGYVAPEIANLKNSGETYNGSCDLFSLGIIFHILIIQKGPFEGKSLDDVLMKNKNCQINFNDIQYKRLPETWLDLMIKLLSKQPKKRITASKALEHKFFEEDKMFKQFVEKRRKESREKARSGSKDKICSPSSCNLNFILSSNKERNKNIKLLEDSCLKFKMIENVFTGKIQQSDQSIPEIDSPMILKKSSGVNVKSRFKSRA